MFLCCAVCCKALPPSFLKGRFSKTLKPEYEMFSVFLFFSDTAVQIFSPRRLFI